MSTRLCECGSSFIDDVVYVLPASLPKEICEAVRRAQSDVHLFCHVRTLKLEYTKHDDTSRNCSLCYIASINTLDVGVVVQKHGLFPKR